MTAPPAWLPATWQWLWHMTACPAWEGAGRGLFSGGGSPTLAIPPAQGLQVGPLLSGGYALASCPLPGEWECHGKEPRDAGERPDST